jgi:hypothetical protein
MYCCINYNTNQKSRKLFAVELFLYIRMIFLDKIGIKVDTKVQLKWTGPGSILSDPKNKKESGP